MSWQAEYEADLLTLQEDVDLDSPANSQTKQPKIAPEIQTINQTGLPIKIKFNQTTPIFRLTPHTLPTLTQPAIINGKPVSDLTTLKATTNILEVRMRGENSYQRFITKEGTSIYLHRNVIKKIKFEENIKRRWDKTINLSQRYQVRLRVTKNGCIMFHHYHKRGQSKFKTAQPI